MKEIFVKPTMDIIVLEKEDIITASAHTDDNGNIELPFVPSN